MQKELQGTLGAYLHNNRIMDNELCTFMQIPKTLFPEIQDFFREYFTRSLDFFKNHHSNSNILISEMDMDSFRYLGR